MMCCQGMTHLKAGVTAETRIALKPQEDKSESTSITSRPASFDQFHKCTLSGDQSERFSSDRTVDSVLMKLTANVNVSVHKNIIKSGRGVSENRAGIQ